MPQSNGRIYTEIRDGVKYGISTDDVAYVLGEVSGDAGTLCTSNNINKYAKYKPCGGSSPASPTEDERKQLNCGINTTNLMFDDFEECLASAKINCDWSKATPITYRLGDFDMYYHGARAPYVPQTNKKGNTSAGSGDSPYIPLAITKNDDIFNGVKVNLKVSDLLGMLEENYNLEDYKYALIFKDANDPEATLYKQDLEMSSGEVIDDINKTIDFTFPVASQTYNTNITYDCVFIVYVDDDGVYEMTYLPNSYFQVQLAFFGIWNSSGTASIDGTTFGVIPSSGSTVPIEMIFSGYEWEAQVMSNEVHARFTPTSGSSVRPYSAVQMEVLPFSGGGSIEGGTVTAKVYVSAPGLSGDEPDFTKEFFIEQRRPTTGPILEFYVNGDRVNVLEIREGLGNELRLDIKYNTDWFVDRIEELNSGTVSTDIHFAPSSRPAPPPNPGWTWVQDVEVYGNVSLVAGTNYRICFRNAASDAQDADIESIELHVVSAT